MISVSKHRLTWKSLRLTCLTQKAAGTAKKIQKRLGDYSFSLSVSPHMENVSASALVALKRATIGQKALKR